MAIVSRPETAPKPLPKDQQASPSSPPSSLLKRRHLQTSLAISVQRDEPAKPADILQDHFDVLKMLGQGSVGSVFHAIRRTDHKHFAVKVITVEDPEMRDLVTEEYDLLRKLDHPNIVRAHDLIMGRNKALLALDFVAGSELYMAVLQTRERCFSEETTRPLSKSLMEAVHHLHEHRIVHRDIKPQNILVTHDLSHLKLADFNVARSLSGCCSLTPTGTKLYAAPEVLLGNSPNEKSDVWSAGVCVYFMLCGHLPQERELSCSEGAMRAAARRPIELDTQRFAHTSLACREFVHYALMPEWTSRMAPMVLLQHRWFNEVEGGDRMVHRNSEGPGRTQSWHVVQENADADMSEEASSPESLSSFPPVGMSHSLSMPTDMDDMDVASVWSRQATENTAGVWSRQASPN